MQLVVNNTFELQDIDSDLFFIAFSVFTVLSCLQRIIADVNSFNLFKLQNRRSFQCVTACLNISAYFCNVQLIQLLV